MRASPRGTSRSSGMGPPSPKTRVEAGDDAVEVRRAGLAEPLVAPLAVDEPGEDLAEERDLGLEEEPGAAAAGVRDAAGVAARRSAAGPRCGPSGRGRRCPGRGSPRSCRRSIVSAICSASSRPSVGGHPGDDLVSAAGGGPPPWPSAGGRGSSAANALAFATISGRGCGGSCRGSTVAAPLWRRWRTSGCSGRPSRATGRSTGRRRRPRQADGRRGSSSISRSWAGLMSWYSSTIRWRRGPWTRAKIIRSSRASRAQVMMQAEGEEVVAVEHLPIGGVALAERRAGQGGGRDQLVADDVDGAHEVPDRLPVLRPSSLPRPMRGTRGSGSRRGGARRGRRSCRTAARGPGAAGSSRRGSSRRTSGRGGPGSPAPIASPTRRTMRSFSSAAARSVKVNATIEAGSAPSAIRRGDAAGDRLGLARSRRRR